MAQGAKPRRMRCPACGAVLPYATEYVRCSCGKRLTVNAAGNVASYDRVRRAGSASEDSRATASASSPIVTEFEERIRGLVQSSRAIVSTCREPRATDPLDAICQMLEETLSATRPVPPDHARLRVALVGRTKAGKSQLVAALTGDDSAVGVGRQRTTREIGVHQLDDFDLIDTPGVAALGGEVDTEKALDAADQADAVLWVYTESLQDSDAEVLAQLLYRGKPVIVAFNVKVVVDKPARRAIFERRPAKYLDRDIEGHRTRIEQVARRAGAKSPELVAFHARAAWWARQDGSSELRSASRIDDLVDACNRTLVPRASSLRIQRDHDAVRHRLVELGAGMRTAVDQPRPERDELVRHLADEAKVLRAAVATAHRGAEARLSAGTAKARSGLKDLLRDHGSASAGEWTPIWEAYLEKHGILAVIDGFRADVEAETRRHGRLFTVTEKARKRWQAQRKHQKKPGRGWRSKLRSGLRVLGNAALKVVKDLGLTAGMKKAVAKLAGRAVPGVGWATVAVDAASAASSALREELARRAAAEDRWRDATVTSLETELTWTVGRVRKQLLKAKAQVDGDVESHRTQAVAALDHLDQVVVSLHEDLDRLSDATHRSDRELVTALLDAMGHPVEVVGVDRRPGKRLKVRLRATSSDSDPIPVALAALRSHFINESVELAGTGSSLKEPL